MTSPTSGPSFLLAIAAIACGDPAAADPPERMTTGAEDSTGGSGSGTTSVPGPDACEASEDCEGQFCVAPYDAGASQRGAAACVATCVGQDDLVRWCIDDAACCEGLSCNAVDGFCVAGAVDEGTSTGIGTTDPGASSSGSGSETSSSSGSSSDSGSGSSSSGS
jgi:hypothetical protein